MSYATPPPPARQRPAVVTASSALLIVVAVMQLVGFATVLSQVGTLNEIYQEAYEGTSLESQAGISTATTVASAVISLLFAAGLVALAVLNAKGKNPARIVTWVLGGILVCLSGCGLLGTAVSMQSMQSDNLGGFDPSELERLMTERLPGWYEPVSLATSLIGLLSLVVALILLALPAANQFFRKPEPPQELPPPAYPPVG